MQSESFNSYSEKPLHKIKYMLKEIVTQVILNAFKAMSLSNFTRIKEGALNRYDILVIQLNCIMF